MDFKRILGILAVGAIAVYLYNHRGGAPSSASSSASDSQGSSGWDGGNMIRLAETANTELHQAALLLLRLPVDQAAWREAEGRVLSAISAAELASRHTPSDKDLAVVTEVTAALSAMRTLLRELSDGASGGGGATSAVQRQETIDSHLNRARELLSR
jgi:hypothetical protein